MIKRFFLALLLATGTPGSSRAATTRRSACRSSLTGPASRWRGVRSHSIHTRTTSTPLNAYQERIYDPAAKSADLRCCGTLTAAVFAGGTINARLTDKAELRGSQHGDRTHLTTCCKAGGSNTPKQARFVVSRYSDGEHRQKVDALIAFGPADPSCLFVCLARFGGTQMKLFNRLEKLEARWSTPSTDRRIRNVA
jgi:hypothetical protein